jgi:hypothetical protein
VQGGRQARLLPTKGGKGCSRVRGGLNTHGDLLEQQVAADVVEGGERDNSLEEGLEMVVPLVQPLKNVEYNDTIRHRLTEVAEGIGHALHLSAVVVQVQVTLDEGPERDIMCRAQGRIWIGGHALHLSATEDGSQARDTRIRGGDERI